MGVKGYGVFQKFMEEVLRCKAENEPEPQPEEQPKEQPEEQPKEDPVKDIE